MHFDTRPNNRQNHLMHRSVWLSFFVLLCTWLFCMALSAKEDNESANTVWYKTSVSRIEETLSHRLYWKSKHGTTNCAEEIVAEMQNAHEELIDNVRAITNLTKDEVRHLLPKQVSTPIYGGGLIFAQRVEGLNGTVLTADQLAKLSRVFKQRDETIDRIRQNSHLRAQLPTIEHAHLRSD